MENGVTVCDRKVHWGDCAPSGAVFYPTYYRWFDEATWTFFAEQGLAISELGKRYGVVGLPLTSCRAQFLRPCRLGDDLTTSTALAAFDSRSIVLSHFVLKDGALAVRGEEIRFWGVRDETDPARLRRASVPEEVSSRLERLVCPPEEGRVWPDAG